MAYYGFINAQGEVVEVFPGRDESEVVEGISDWEAYYATKREGLTCLRTSYNTRGGVHYDPETGEPSADQSKALRFNYAGIGYTYDEERDAFIPPKPFDSWIVNEDTCLWEAPIAMPVSELDADGKPVTAYSWDETQGDWVEIQEPSA